MKHYSEYEWTQYFNDTVEYGKREEMDSHLLKCNDCLEIYLSVVEKCDLPEEIGLSAEFTNQVLSKIDFHRSSTKREITKKTIFKYYIAAASITMLLMYSGFFQVFIEEVPNLTIDILESTKQVESIVTNGWSQRFMNATVEKLNFMDIGLGRDYLND